MHAEQAASETIDGKNNFIKKGGFQRGALKKTKQEKSFLAWCLLLNFSLLFHRTFNQQYFNYTVEFLYLKRFFFVFVLEEFVAFRLCSSVYAESYLLSSYFSLQAQTISSKKLEILIGTLVK